MQGCLGGDRDHENLLLRKTIMFILFYCIDIKVYPFIVEEITKSKIFITSVLTNVTTKKKAATDLVSTSALWH